MHPDVEAVRPSQVYAYVDGVPLRTYTAKQGGINPKWVSNTRKDFKNEKRIESPGVDLLFVVTGFPKFVTLDVMDEDADENGAGNGFLGSGTVELQKPLIDARTGDEIPNVANDDEQWRSPEQHVELRDAGKDKNRVRFVLIT
eukprot:SAG31_NODE_727_length_12536_cov_2.306022_3_plen_143_part_00